MSENRNMTHSTALGVTAALLGLVAVVLTIVVPTAGRASEAPSSSLAMMDDKMGGSGGMTPGMGGMQSGTPQMGSGAAPGGPMTGGMGMGCCMGAMGQGPGSGTSMSPSMAMPSALPGFPGASHLYHVGATGFFLEHADKIGLNVEQRTKLNGIKQRALGEQSSGQRRIDEAEQALWMLTAADQPDAAAIEAKLGEIEKMRAGLRLAFIRAVGEAANVLTPDQRKVVLGLVPMPGTATASPTK